jgi:hypothetical protein
VGVAMTLRGGLKVLANSYTILRAHYRASIGRSAGGRSAYRRVASAALELITPPCARPSRLPVLTSTVNDHVGRPSGVLLGAVGIHTPATCSAR